MDGGRPENFQHMDPSNPSYKKVSDGYYKATYLSPKPGEHRPEDETDPDTGLTNSEAAERQTADKIMASKKLSETVENEKEKYFRIVTGMTIREAQSKLPQLIVDKEQYTNKIELLMVQLDKLIADKPEMNFDNLSQNQEWISAMGEISKVKNTINDLQSKIDWINKVIEEIEKF